ncbi:MAG TPA: hypothetical protein PLE77_00610 [Kiritimatiellia bacterium]|nr:hypothetical protein [Kiritimatiellia bacterium]
MRKTAFVLIVISLCFAGVGAAWAQDAGALVQHANTCLRDAQNHFFGGRMSQAEASLAGAEASVTALKGVDSANVQIASLEQKCAKMRKDIDARKPKAATSPAAPAATTAAPAGDKLPSGAQFRLKEAGRSLDKVDRILSGVSSADYKVEAARAAVQEAKDKLAEITSMFGAQASPDAPEMKAVSDRIAAAEKQINGVQAGAAQAAVQQDKVKAVAEEWLNKMKPYVMGQGNSEHNPDKYLVPGSTSDLKELVRRQALWREATALLAEYEKAGLSNVSDELAEAERQLRYAVKSFDESYKSHIERAVQDAERRAGEIDTFLKRQEAAAGQAILLEKDQLGELQKKIDEAGGLAGIADARVSALRSMFSGLQKRDAALRQARVEQTRMTADRYTSEDLAQLKQRAEAITRESLANANILRTTITSAGWKEESVIEPTDTTHTALRFRTTRSVTAQVAAKQGDKVQLHTLDLSKDLQAGGAWGPVYGHIMFSDPMLEKNVK